MKCRPFFGVFFSHYFVPIIVFICMIISILSTYTKVKIKGFKSQSPNSLNLTDDPDYIVQVSDMHYTHINPNITKRLTTLLKEIIKTYKPKIMILSGDLSDGSNSRNLYSFHMQYQETWDLIEKSFNESRLFDSNIELIFTPGNHDMFAVSKNDFTSNKFRKYLLNNSEFFDFQNYKYQIGRNTINIVVFSPLKPPVSSSPFGIFPYVSKSLLNKLEDSVDENSFNILVNHFPRRFLWSNPSKNGRRIRGVTNLYDAMLSGHRHPQRTTVSMHDGLLHSICPAAKNRNHFAIMTYDNGNFVSHYIDNSSRTSQALVTFPVPYNQLTKKNCFNQEKVELRMIYFGNKTDDLSVNVDNKTYYNISVVKQLKDNVYLLKSDIVLEKGFHEIEVKNGFYKNKYFVGDEVEDRYEMEVTFQFNSFRFLMFAISMTVNPYLVIGICIFVCFYTFVRIIPFWRIESINTKLLLFDDYMEKREEIKFYQVILYGIMDYFMKLRRVPILSYYIILFDTVFVYFIPLFVSGLDNGYSAIFVYGQVYRGEISYFGLTFFIFIIYNILFVSSIGTFTSYFYEANRNYIELVVSAFPFLFMTGGMHLFLYITGMIVSNFASPFTYISIISIIIIIIDMVKHSRRIRIYNKSDPLYP